MGVDLRRRFGVDRGRLTAYEDERLTRGDTTDETSTRSAILAAEIERPRSGPTRDIVSTIQPEQDESVRSDIGTSICVQGAPGTGKTAVGLHRAAWLLYSFRAQPDRSGVLVVGPNRAFLDHIGTILPRSARLASHTPRSTPARPRRRPSCMASRILARRRPRRFRHSSARIILGLLRETAGAVVPAADVRCSSQEVVMRTMSYDESRARYAEVLDNVVDDREEVVITRAGHEPVVIVSLEEYESLREVAYLMRSPANARRLLDSMERLEAGRGTTHELAETE
ncbi:MAG: type II toxin-antitoxin system prevent-host-death family antitoxin [Phycicoccus sp.]